MPRFEVERWTLDLLEEERIFKGDEEDKKAVEFMQVLIQAETWAGCKRLSTDLSYAA